MNDGQFFIYARRSSDREDHQVLSLESQLEVLRELAARKGIEVVGELTESASAREPGRPVFSELMRRVEAGKVAGILVWRLDRLARNMMDGGQIIYELTQGKLKEIVTPEATYTGTPDSKFMLAMLFGAAAKYTDDLSAAVRRGNRDVLKRGKVPGPVPLGYLKTHEHELVAGPGIAVPDPERFDLVKQLWRDVLGGSGTVTDAWRKAVASGLTTRPTPHVLARSVSLTNVYALLRNPFYAGKIVRGDKEYRGEHPPMLTEDEFKEIATRLAHARVAMRPVGHASFLYSGLLHCGHCERLLSGERHAKSDHTYIYYRCGRRRAGRWMCHAVAPTEENLTTAFLELLPRLHIDPAIFEAAQETLESWAIETAADTKSFVTKTKRVLGKAEHDLVTLTDLAIDGRMTKEEYSVRRSNQLKRMDNLREALARPLATIEAWRAARKGGAGVGPGLADVFRHGDASERRAVLTRAFEHIQLKDGTILPVVRYPFVLRPEVPATNMISRTDSASQSAN